MNMTARGTETTEKVAIVTAGGSGMGAATARKLAELGFHVAILSSSAKGEALATELGGIGVTGRVIRDQASSGLHTVSLPSEPCL